MLFVKSYERQIQNQTADFINALFHVHFLHNYLFSLSVGGNKVGRFHLGCLPEASWHHVSSVWHTEHLWGKVRSDDALLAFRFLVNHVHSCYTLELLFSLCSSGSKRKPFISLDQLMDFINRRQRDSRLNEVLYPPLKRDQVRQIMEKYETNTSQLERGL